MSEQQKQVWDTLWSREVCYDWDALSQTVFEEILHVIQSIKGKQILEAGSGTGKISLQLAKEGADVTLVDYSDNALNNSRNAFGREGCQGTFILSDIRQLNAPLHKYDLTWNAGVLEHFSFEEKVTILKQMARVTKSGGQILVLTPYAKCLPYLVGKAYAEKHNTWMYGVEDPVTSLESEFAASGITLTHEHHIGFVNSLDFLDFIPQAAPVKEGILAWYNTLSEVQKDDFPGYLLASVGVTSR